jgi:hypothetical protein
MLQQYKIKQGFCFTLLGKIQQNCMQCLRTIDSDSETNIPAGGSLVLIMTNSGSLQHWDSSFQTASLFIFSKLL